jgi:hypothetical protein
MVTCNESMEVALLKFSLRKMYSQRPSIAIIHALFTIDSDTDS